MALVVKNPPANAGDIRDAGPIPGQEGPLEEAMATHSSVLAWRIPQTEEPGRLQSAGLQRVRHSYRDWARTHEEPLASVMGQALCLTCCLPSN